MHLKAYILPRIGNKRISTFRLHKVSEHCSTATGDLLYPVYQFLVIQNIIQI